MKCFTFLLLLYVIMNVVNYKLVLPLTNIIRYQLNVDLNNPACDVCENALIYVML